MIRRAMTLVELLMVLAIISVVATLAVPRFAQAQQRYRAQAAARQIAELLRYAQSESRAHNSIEFVYFLPSWKMIFCSFDPDMYGEDYLGMYSINIEDPPFEATLKSASFQGLPYCWFYANGQPRFNGSVVVAVGEHEATVTINANSGRITIE